MHRIILICSTFLITAPFSDAQANWWEDFSSIFQSSSIEDFRTRRGLKSELREAIKHAVNVTSQPGGFSKDASIRISFPEELSEMKNALQKIGMDGQLAELERKLNEVAEKTAASSLSSFQKAVSQLEIPSPKRVSSNESGSASSFFKNQLANELLANLKPETKKVMAQIGAGRHFQRLVEMYEAIPASRSKIYFMLENYVTMKTIDGILHVAELKESNLGNRK